MMSWIMNQNQIKKLLQEFPGATRKKLMALGDERKIGNNVDSGLVGLIRNKEITYKVDKRIPGDHNVGNRPRKYFLVE